MAMYTPSDCDVNCNVNDTVKYVTGWARTEYMFTDTFSK